MSALQVFVAGAVAVTCVATMLRANKDEHEVPPPAPGSVGDAMVHLQGPADCPNVLRHLREIGRQKVEHVARIAECRRAAREQLTAQADLLRSIDREWVPFAITTDREWQSGTLQPRRQPPSGVFSPA